MTLPAKLSSSRRNFSPFLLPQVAFLSYLVILVFLSRAYSTAKLSIVLSDKISLVLCRRAYASTYCAVQVSGSDPPEFPFSPFFFLTRPCELNSRENRIFRSIGGAFYVRRMRLYYPCRAPFSRSNLPIQSRRLQLLSSEIHIYFSLS